MISIDLRSHDGLMCPSCGKSVSALVDGMRRTDSTIDSRSSVQQPPHGGNADVQQPRYARAATTVRPTDIPGVGPSGWTMVADSGEHPDRRIPYALSHEGDQ